MKKLLSITLMLAALPALAQDIGALTADTKKAVLPVVPKVVAAMQEAVAEKGGAGAIPVCKEEAPALIKESARKQAGISAASACGPVTPIAPHRICGKFVNWPISTSAPPTVKRSTPSKRARS